MIFVGIAMRLRTRQDLADVSVQNCKFRPSIMVGVPAVWENIRKSIVGNVNSRSPITKATFDGVMYVPALVQLADSLVLSSYSSETCYLG